MTRLYPGMAFTNIKSNRRTYIPYMLSCTVTTAIYYVICSLAGNRNLADMWGGNIIQSYMGMGQVIVAIFAVIFLFYINSFLIKRRSSEFGLYNILGMEKRHITKVILFENLYTFAAVMASGIMFGILLDKLMYLVLSRIFDGALPIGFYVSGSAIMKSLALFGVIFILILLNSVRQIYKAKPVDLLRSSSAGEREPKAKWVLAVIGLICLGVGYFIAVTTENPVAAFMLFFVAVILVIIGTYLLFTAGSIALLKLLRKNKGYYYKTKHFISVSSMMYRMKRNAVGLANICILSTMVLVMISATLSIYLGLDDSIEKRYPADFSIESVADDPLNDDAEALLKEAIRNQGLTVKKETAYSSLSVSAVYDSRQNMFVADPDNIGTAMSIKVLNDLSTFVFVTLEDYNRCMGADETLESESDVLIYSNRQALPDENINIFDESFHVVKTLDDFMVSGNMAANISNGHFIVVKDMSVIERLLADNLDIFGKYGSYIGHHYMLNILEDSNENSDALAEAYDSASKQISALSQPEGYDADGFTGYLECRSVEAESYGVDFAGLFFIGIFLGLLFIMATVLIMYYKQLTEGCEDQTRFEIMQNVGMSHKEVRSAINSQILIIFFLPLVTAGVHVAFAFPFIFRILTLMNLFNFSLFAACTAGCFLAFTVFYVITYILTSRLYYRIVKK